MPKGRQKREGRGLLSARRIVSDWLLELAGEHETPQIDEALARASARPLTSGVLEVGPSNTWDGLPPELREAALLQADKIRYGTCYLEVTPDGPRRIDPAKMHGF